jgi:midasin (ATPase involved in ribosome maturation)
VLGERSRSPQDRQFIKKTIETTLRCTIDEEKFYDTYFAKHALDEAFKTLPANLGIPRLVVSK